MSAAPPSLWPWQEKSQELPEGTSTLGLALFFVTLSVLFIASVIGVVVVKYQFDVVSDPVQFPSVGWQWSTLCLVLVSGLVHVAVRAVRVDSIRTFQACMVGAFLASVGFLYFQKLFWSALFDQHGARAESVESGFYAIALLTVLHAIHVVGGILYHGLVTYRSLRKRYWSLQHGPVRAAALYWHFIDAVWLFLLGFLLWLA